MNIWCRWFGHKLHIDGISQSSRYFHFYKLHCPRCGGLFGEVVGFPFLKPAVFRWNVEPMERFLKDECQKGKL